MSDRTNGSHSGRTTLPADAARAVLYIIRAKFPEEEDDAARAFRPRRSASTRSRVRRPRRRAADRAQILDLRAADARLRGRRAPAAREGDREEIRGESDGARVRRRLASRQG